MNNTTKIAVGVAAGVALGAVLGILFAPAKGADTRKKIVDEGKDLAGKLAEKAADVTKLCGHCKEKDLATT